MSQAVVERILGKLVTDECFRSRFFEDPGAASFLAGLELSQTEVDALLRLPVEAIARFSACLDHRICRLPVDEVGRSTRQRAPRVRQGRTASGAGPACDPAQMTKEDQP